MARFAGVQSCQSSSCHSGAGPGRDECLTLAQKDFHARAYAILTTARSERIAEALRIPGAVSSAECTICHSPFQALPAASRARTARADEGVSCESCHGAAEPWLRAHTRKDYRHADRVASGMRDLKDLYVRGNSCVACHEHISPELLRAGHPKLVFELDSQTVSQPPHWVESDPWAGARAWLVGQAIALRENSWQTTKTGVATPRWRALVWLLARVTSHLEGLPKVESPARVSLSREDFAAMQAAADKLARSAGSWECTIPMLEKLLVSLAGAHGDFTLPGDREELASRAEALTQALDRLVISLKHHGRTYDGVEDLLAGLFADVRIPSVFEPSSYAAHLQQLRKALPHP